MADDLSFFVTQIGIRGANPGAPPIASESVLLAARLELDPDTAPLRPRMTKRPSPAPMANAKDMDELLAHLRAAFLAIGYTHPHTVEAMVRSWHEMFARAGLHRREAAMIRGLAQQILWSAQFLPEEVRPRPRPPGD